MDGTHFRTLLQVEILQRQGLCDDPRKDRGQDACLHRISDNFRVERPLSGQVFLHSED